ncbi:MAG: response regulator [Defluviitaleaceae bacterium]|nr:response regulator [Defluviitaleaceae bacterium]
MRNSSKQSLRSASGFIFVLLGSTAIAFAANLLNSTFLIAITVAAVAAILFACLYFFVIRKNAREQEQIRQTSNERFSLMLDTVPLVVRYWSANLEMIDCNRAACDAYNFSDKEAFIKNQHEYFERCGQAAKILRSELKNAFDTGECSFVFEDRYSDGKLMLTEVDGIRTVLGGEPVVITYSRDVTQIKKAESEVRRREVAEEANRAKSEFLARMSHEIRTPINAVLGISEIELRKSGLPLHAKESFAKINNSANLLLTIVNDILDLSKIEAGKMVLIPKAYNLASVINDVAQINIGYLDTKNLEFRMRVDENLPAGLIGDDFRIRQILNNVLSNAFKYTERGYVELTWNSRSYESDRVMLEITITDTGFGMTKSQLYILQNSEYTRFHEHENRNIDGTGLGLPIVHKMLRLMDGHVKIESEVNEGTKVSVHIPQQIIGTGVIGREIADKLQKFEKAMRVTGENFAFVPESMPYGKVLIVDDVDANVYVAKGLLAFYDLNVETSVSGYEAIDRVKRGEVFDVIFMDHMMPGLDGFETMKILRDKGYTAPIVALTANAIIGQAEEFIKGGFDDFISKPIQTNHLNATLHKFVKDKQPPDVIAAATQSRSKKPAPSSNNLAERMRLDFAKNHADGFKNLKTAIDAHDTESAILAAHTLKGVAGLIGEKELATSAARVEQILAKGDTPSTKLLDSVEGEMFRILGDAPQDNAKNSRPLDERGSLALLAEIEPLLMSQDTECLNFVNNLKNIPQSETLCRQIENFDFDDALKTLYALKSELEVVTQ